MASLLQRKSTEVGPKSEGSTKKSPHRTEKLLTSASGKKTEGVGHFHLVRLGVSNTNTTAMYTPVLHLPLGRVARN